jgi:hypothetical protein
MISSKLLITVGRFGKQLLNMCLEAVSFVTGVRYRLTKHRMRNKCDGPSMMFPCLEIATRTRLLAATGLNILKAICTSLLVEVDSDALKPRNTESTSSLNVPARNSLSY